MLELLVGLTDLFILDFIIIPILWVIELVVWVIASLFELLVSLFKSRRPKKVKKPVIWRPNQRNQLEK